MKTENKSAGAAQFPTPGRVQPGPASLSSQVKVDLAASSHEGKVRSNNEDSYLVTRFKRSLYTLLTNLPAGQVPEQYNEAGYLMLVADGMGGAAAGEVASRTAISTLVDLVLQTPDWIMRPDRERVGEVLRRMEERFGRLSKALAQRAGSDPNLAGMGTTMTLAVSLGAGLIVAHVGDSRAYLFRTGQLLRLTRDQTVAQVLADAGAISRADVERHHARHVLTSALTARGEKAEVQLFQLRLMDGDQILLCSDGLTEKVTDASIAAVLEKGGAAAGACRALVNLALMAGGEDNVTVVLGRYRIPDGVTQAEEGPGAHAA